MKISIDVKLKRLTNEDGINKHQHWICTFKNVDTIDIYSNEDMLGNKWRLTDYEGSLTTWYKTKKEAIKAYIENGYFIPIKGEKNE